MASSDELYPGLDTELDEAFRRHTGTEGSEATLEEVVQEELQPKTTGEANDIPSLIDEANQLTEEAQQDNSYEQLHETLVDRAEVIKKILEAQSSTSRLQVEGETGKADQTTYESSETAKQDIQYNRDSQAAYDEAKDFLERGAPSRAKDFIEANIQDPREIERIETALDIVVLDEAKSFLDRGAPSRAEEHIEKYASSRDSAERMRVSLDTLVMEQATDFLEKGAPSRAVEHIINHSSSTSAASRMRESLDRIVLQQAIDFIDRGAPSRAIELIDKYASSQRAGWLIREALDPTVLSRAKEFQDRGAPSRAQEHITQYATTDTLKDKMRGVLGL